MKATIIGLLSSLLLAYLAGVFITLDFGWVDVFAWSNGERAFFLFNALMLSGLGATFGSAFGLGGRS